MPASKKTKLARQAQILKMGRSSSGTFNSAAQKTPVVKRSREPEVEFVTPPTRRIKQPLALLAVEVQQDSKARPIRSVTLKRKADSSVSNKVKELKIAPVESPNGWRTYIVFIPYDKDLPRRFRDDFLKMESKHPEKICKNGMYEKDMLKWVDFNDLEDFNKDVRRWYKKVVKLLGLSSDGLKIPRHPAGAV